MQILQLLSEDIFDFSMDGMTADKAKALKESLNEEFSQNQGGPNHLKNFCDASLVLTEAGDDIVAQPRTFYMGFFSGLRLGWTLHPTHRFLTP